MFICVLHIWPPQDAAKPPSHNIPTYTHRTVTKPQCVCAQYILAVERLKKKGQTPLRTVHLSFVPDEEVRRQRLSIDNDGCGWVYMQTYGMNAPKEGHTTTSLHTRQIGGADGMAKLLETPLFKEGLNVGIALDEGIANPGGCFGVWVGGM